MPVTGCTWRSSPNAPGCWDRGEPPRPVRVGHSHPTAGSLPSPGAGCVLHCLAASGACVGPGGRGWTSAHSLHQWLGMPRMPHTQVPRLGTSCACGDISVRPGASCAPGDGIAVPDGVECPRPGRHAPGHVECPRWWREPDGYGCSVWPGPDSGAQARVSRTPRRCCYFLRRSPRLEPEVVWSSWRRGWVEGRGLEGRRVVALIDSARVVAAGPGTLIPPLGAPIPEPVPFPASHPFWFSCRHPEVVVRRRVRPTSALSRPIARGRGSTGRGLCVLHEGPTYLEYPRPSSSRSPPSCSARWRHQITASNGNQDRRTRCTSGSGCHGCPTLRRRGWGHPARAGTFLCGRGQVTRSGTGLLSPTASNAPARNDTHPAAWNVPVVGDGLLDEGARGSRMQPEACSLYSQGPCSWPQVRSRRRAGSVVRTHGATGTRPRRTLGSVARTRPCRTTARCVLGDARARSSARTEWQEDGRVRRRRTPGGAVRTDGMPEDRRGASRRAGLATPWELTVIVTTRPHRKDVTGVPG